MKYRKFGNLTEDVSILGLGVSQLPQANAEQIDASVSLIRQAIDGGINYLDLGPTDHFRQYDRIGELLRTALQDGYREKVTLAAHQSVGAIDTASDVIKNLDRQLQWTHEQHFDCYFLDGLQRDTWPVLQRKGALDYIETALKEDRIGSLGFSFRDQHQYLRKILEEYGNWDLCQFQYNYMEVDRNPGLNGIRYAVEHGLGVVVAEPLRGGMLINQPPESIAEIWAGSGYERSLVEWSLRWLWNHPEISSVVCDMKTPQQLQENLALANIVEANCLSIREQILINEVRDAYRKLRPIPCNTCRTCMPCPKDIDVPRILELYNEAAMYDDSGAIQEIYRNEEHDLSECDECGTCVENCGRMVAILDWLQQAKTLFEDRETDT